MRDTKIKAGDSVSVGFKGEVVSAFADNIVVNSDTVIKTDFAGDYHVPISAIVNHIPAPRIVSIGDELRGALIGCQAPIYTVRGVYNGWVWFGGNHVVRLEDIHSNEAAGR